jgi:hypothetical protein
MAGRAAVVLAGLWLTALVAHAAGRQPEPAQAAHAGVANLFQTAGTCMACHRGLVTPAGEDVSIGADWRASMMANSARDPYWQAAVRREIIDHPDAREAIEDECSICHMPMTTYAARAAGAHGEIFAHLPVRDAATPEDLLAADGVSCAVCHQIAPDGLGTPESFTGGYVIDTARAAGERRVFGPYEVDAGRTTVMRSASGFVPSESTHVQSSEFCASCHTLFTNALGEGHQVIGRLAEQMPYLEWQHSAYRDETSCQACHMPTVDEAMPITGVLGQPREGFSRHTFRGGNFFMMRVLNRYRDELGVAAPSREMDAAIRRTIDHLQQDTSRVTIAEAAVSAGRVRVDVDVENLAGHKLPTAYPSRRVWLHVTVRDVRGTVLFESGAFRPDGVIEGNDNDETPGAFEPHHTEIAAAEDVQVYESIMVGADGTLTTGLLTGVRYVKDNRLLPAGFDKATATDDIAVTGAAATDADFGAGRDRIRYDAALGSAPGPFTVDVELWYQPIGFRWADNLRAYDAFETRRFVRYYESLAAVSAVVVSRASITVQ